MQTQPYTCPECKSPLELYANGDNGPADDRWSCHECGIEYPHAQFPLPTGYVARAKAIEAARDEQHRQEEDQWRLAEWQKWATRQ